MVEGALDMIVPSPMRGQDEDPIVGQRSDEPSHRPLEQHSIEMRDQRTDENQVVSAGRLVAEIRSRTNDIGRESRRNEVLRARIDLAGMEPTGRRISLEVYEFGRVDGGKIAERWVALKPSISEMIQQLRSAGAA